MALVYSITYIANVLLVNLIMRLVLVTLNVVVRPVTGSTGARYQPVAGVLLRRLENRSR